MDTVVQTPQLAPHAEVNKLSPSASDADKPESPVTPQQIRTRETEILGRGTGKVIPAETEGEFDYTPTVKAFANTNFILSHDARPIRILCEFEETKARLRNEHVHGTILFFGSARSRYASDLALQLQEAEDDLKKAEEVNDAKKATDARIRLQRMKRCEWMTKFCDMSEELAKKITEWCMHPDVRRSSGLALARSDSYLNEGRPSLVRLGPTSDAADFPQSYVVCSGGGPGLMEAVNKGARSVPGARSMGMGISLPFEKGLNKYVTPELAFEFHYFFTRKFWMMYPARAIIACPGGFGTLDELFEALTLKQTGKLDHSVPIVLLGKEFWNSMINWKGLADLGVISHHDAEELLITDDIDEAFDFVTARIHKIEKHEVHHGRPMQQTPAASPALRPASSTVPEGLSKLGATQAECDDCAQNIANREYKK